MLKQANIEYPARFNFIIKFRNVTDSWLSKLPLPNINPTLVSVLSVIAAIGFVLADQNSLQIVALALLILCIVFDWLDGVIAKKYQRTSWRGWWVDSVCDRLSEGIILISFWEPWYSLWLINCFLMLYSSGYKINVIQPARIYFLIYYLSWVVLK